MEDQMLEIIKRFNVRNSDKRSRGEQGQHEKAGSYLPLLSFEWVGLAGQGRA
jgi:hypothetical protein